MTAYELIQKQMNSPDFTLMLKAGLIPLTVAMKYNYYKAYLDFIDQGQPRTTAAQLAADKYCLQSIASIYEAKQFFEKKID